MPVNARAWVSLALSGTFGLLGVGLRSWMHRRRTGRSPLRHGAGASARVALAGNTVAFVAGPVDRLAFGATPLVHGQWLAWPGLGLSLGSLGVLLWSQSAMGESLRIGVDPAERTALVTTGPFRWVRHPIYSAMVAYVAGVAVLVPVPVSLVALGAHALAMDLHVRRVEEPYLAAVHGPAYADYTADVGRFVPNLGRLNRQD